MTSTPADILARRLDDPDPVAVAFVLELVRALHTYGASAQRLEDILVAISERLGLVGAQCFSTPTSIMASFGPTGRQRTHMLRVRPGEVSLGRLAEVEQVSIEVAQGLLSPATGLSMIARIAGTPSPYGELLHTLSFGIVSGAACQFLGGGAREMIAASVLGLGVGVMARFAALEKRIADVFEPLAAFLVSAAAVAMANAGWPLSVFVTTLAGLVVLMPGLTLTTALNELATRHLASGTARLSGAIITFLSIAFGVALGNRVGAAVFGAPPVVDPMLLPEWVRWVMLVVAPLAFTVLLRADPRDAPWIVAVGALGAEAGRFAATALGVELGAFVGAFAVAVASTIYERWRHRPAAVVAVPGLLLLVPGAVGFRSLSSLMERQAVAGIETAFSASLTAMALVAGLLVASVFAPEPRIAAPAPDRA